jgi:hypothetical protein
MIEIHTTEQRTQIQPGMPPMTVVREVTLKNGKGRKTLRVLRGSKVVSTETEPLNLRETKHVHKRKFVKGLYKKMERRTLKRLN